MRIVCPVCGNYNAQCEWDMDSDGAAYTWITWHHYCPHCKYEVRKVDQWMYNYEDVEHCQLPDHRTPPSEGEGYRQTVQYALNRDINTRSPLQEEIDRLRVQLKEKLDKLELLELGQQASKEGGVFISYAHADQDVASKIASRFDSDRVSYWLDEKEIDVGQVIDKAISEGIQKSWAFLILVTPASIASRWVERELDEAAHEETLGKKIVLPVIAKIKSEDVPPRLRRKFYVDLTSDFEKGYTRLLRSIKRYQTAMRGNQTQIDQVGLSD